MGRRQSIGIETDWPEENIPAYLAMLVDEINEKTDYDLLLQPWQQHGNAETRIRVKHKPSEMDSLVRAIGTAHGQTVGSPWHTGGPVARGAAQ